MGAGGAKSKYFFFGTCFCVLLIITIGLIAGSFAVLTPQEYGLKWNSVTMTFDDSTVYTAGRIYVGVGGSFYRFPKKLTYVEFSNDKAGSLDVWSHDGQLLYVEVSFYYRLNEANIHDIFYTYGTDIDGVIRYMAAEEIRRVTTQYDTIDFFTNRSAIDTAMTQALQARIAQDGFAQVTLFNLLGIDVPDTFDRAVATKVITGQTVFALEELRQSQVIQTTIDVINARAQANITVINADASARGAVTVQQNNAAIFSSYMTQKAALLGQLATDLNFTSVEQLMQFLYTDIIRGATETAPTIAFGAQGLQTS